MRAGDRPRQGFLHQVLGVGGVAGHPQRSPVELVEILHRVALETRGTLFGCLGRQIDNGFGVGNKNSLAVGALQFGSQTVELWALYPFYGTANAPLGSAGIPKGRYFPVAKIEAVEDVEIGTTENLKLIAFSMQNLWGGPPSAGGALPLGFKCYSENSADFPADVALANVQ